MGQLLWKTVGHFLETLYDPAVPPLGTYPKELGAGTQNRYLYTYVHSRLFIIAKRCEQRKCLLMDGETKCDSISIQWVIIQLKKEGTHAITWMNFEGIKLSEIHQSQNDKCYVVPLI